MQMQPSQPSQSSLPSATPQQEAMRVLRERYERGEIEFETFQRGLDALLLARDADECQAIMNGLPSLPVSQLDQLDALSRPTSFPAPVQPAGRPHRLVAFFSQVKRMSHAWKVDPYTTGGAIFGQMDLDLNLAALPPHVTMTLDAIFGQVTVYVPETARVRVRSSAFMGGATVFGEWSGGIFVSDETSSDGTSPDHPEATTIDLQVRAFFGEVKVIQGSNQTWYQKLGTVVRRMIADPESGRLSRPS